MAELKSTLRVLNEADLEGKTRAGEGGITKVLVGNEERPSERLRVNLVSFHAGAHPQLHWHLIEGLYYVISGNAVLTDIENRSYKVGPGSAIYAPPGIEGSHGWDFKEPLQLIAFRASKDPGRAIQFYVDESTKESRLGLDELMKRGGAKIKSFY